MGIGFDLSSFDVCFESFCCFGPSLDGPDCGFGTPGAVVFACALRACFSAFALFFSSAFESSVVVLVVALFVVGCGISCGCCGGGADGCSASAAGVSDIFNIFGVCVPSTNESGDVVCVPVWRGSYETCGKGVQISG